MLGRLTAGALFLAGVGVVAHATNPTVAWPLKVDPTGRLLVDQNGVPFPIVGDTAWHMQVNLMPDEMDTYFADRDARGINTIIVMAMNKCDWTGADARDQVDSGVPGIFPDDYNGNKAFTDDRAWNASRVEAYWHTVDLIVEKAQEHNMLVFFAPAYLGYECSDDNEGWCRDMIAQTDADMTEWGRWIGSRYKDRRNVIWVDGGDATARNSNNPGSLDRVQALRDALYATTPALLHTSHPSNKDMGADVYPWIDVYELYNEKNYPTGWSLVAPRANYLYSKLGPDGRHHPIFQIEGIYETQQDSGPKVWAAQFMYVALGGGIGGIYGNSYVNRFWLTTNHPCDWSGSCGLASPGSLQQANLGRLYRSRAWWRLVPDYDHTVVTQGYGTFQSPVWPFRNALGESDYVAVARTDDGESVMTWHPLASAITMDLSKISGTSATCWWYSPPDGSATPIGTFPTSGTQSFTPPDVNRVLVCDDAAKALPAPGGGDLPVHSRGEPPHGIRHAAVHMPGAARVRHTGPAQSVRSLGGRVPVHRPLLGPGAGRHAVRGRTPDGRHRNPRVRRDRVWPHGLEPGARRYLPERGHALPLSRPCLRCDRLRRVGSGSHQSRLAVRVLRGRRRGAVLPRRAAADGTQVKRRRQDTRPESLPRL